MNRPNELNVEAVMRAVEQFEVFASAIGAQRRQLIEQGFSAEAAEKLVVMMLTKSLGA